MIRGTKRKRAVFSCVPCYSKKQKCNRQYPCDHCTRRRRPELCTYLTQTTASDSASSASDARICPTKDAAPAQLRRDDQWPTTAAVAAPESATDDPNTSPNPSPPRRDDDANPDSLAELFGYFEDSETNTLGMLRRFGLDDPPEPSPSNESGGSGGATVPAALRAEVQRTLNKIPPRSVLDFLVQYFFAEVNWASQCVHPPTFLAQYERWWSTVLPSSSTATTPALRVTDIEFAALILRTAGLSAQFLPAPSCPVDRLGEDGIPLEQIRKVCREEGGALAELCVRASPRASLCRVQHMSHAGLTEIYEGNMRSSWSTLCKGIEVAQSIGLHREPPEAGGWMDEIEKEWRRRVFCNLYIWDSCLARTLDRMPFLAWEYCTVESPKMHLPSSVGDDVSGFGDPDGLYGGIDPFTERILAQRLWLFWNSLQTREEMDSSRSRPTPYDPCVAEERYERFCTEYLPTLPAPFAVDPKYYSSRAPSSTDAVPKGQPHQLPRKLARQRALHHIAIWDSVCYNFKHLLRLGPAQVRTLPRYKQEMLRRQRRTLARATLAVLQDAATLHALYGSTYTRMALITLYTFEEAVLLACLCLHNRTIGDDGADDIGVVSAEKDGGGGSNQAGTGNSSASRHPTAADPLLARGLDVSPRSCLLALEDALQRLELLSEGSPMAQLGAKSLARLLDGVKAWCKVAPSPSSSSGSAATSSSREVRANTSDDTPPSQSGSDGDGDGELFRTTTMPPPSLPLAMPSIRDYGGGEAPNTAVLMPVPGSYKDLEWLSNSHTPGGGPSLMLVSSQPLFDQGVIGPWRGEVATGATDEFLPTEDFLSYDSAAIGDMSVPQGMPMSVPSSTLPSAHASANSFATDVANVDFDYADAAVAFDQGFWECWKGTSFHFHETG